jgi:anti-sigma B factor antagonist
VSKASEATGTEDRDARTWRIDLHGDLELESAPALRDQLEDLAGRQAALVVVDLSRVSFLDSSGLRALVHGARAIEDGGGRLFVEGASGAVTRVLEVTDLLGRLSADG